MSDEILQVPGGEIYPTGGGCVGIRVPAAKGGYVLITRCDTEGEPPLAGDTHVDVGVYDRDSWLLEPLHERMPVADFFARLPGWIA